MNLNKNQTKFFVAAINHFGEESNDVRLKDLTEFATNNELIVPTSALKNICQEEGLVRGHYNLLLTGITPNIEEPEEPVEMSSFTPPKEDVIVETSAFAKSPAPIKVKGNVPLYVVEKGQKEKVWKRPIYVVSDGDGNVVGVHETPKGAFDRRIQVFHDHGLMSYEDFLTRMKYVGGAIIPSSTASSLHCLIEIMEIQQ